MELINSILDKLKIIKNVDMVSLLLKKICFKEFGIIIKKLKEFKKFNMENIMDNFKMVKDLEKDSFFGIMENIIKVNGKMEKNMVVDIGNQIKVKVILVSGIMDKYQDMEFIQ
jgi:hypothetical protein